MDKAKKRVALCFRGMCMDRVTNYKNGKVYGIDYANFWKHIRRELIKPNQAHCDFDIYMHGWIGKSYLPRIPKVLKDMNPVDYLLEEQRDFTSDYMNLADYSTILYQRLGVFEPDKKASDYDDIHYRGSIRSLLSYAYSISRASQLLQKSDEEYDFGISMRFDVLPLGTIDLSGMDEGLFYINENGCTNPGPMFVSDFFWIASKSNISLFSRFYDFVKNNIFHNVDYSNWYHTQSARVDEFPKSKFDEPMYGNHSILAYFLWVNGITVEKLRTTVPGSLARTGLARQKISLRKRFKGMNAYISRKRRTSRSF